MQIKINTDRHIQGDERLKEVVRAIVEQGLGHTLARLTRAEVHLQDENGQKGGADDIRCMIEGRPQGMDPLAATHNDANVEAAARGAARKLRALLETEFGKVDRKR
ncbi:MAG: HPF/RaiA family ribosome-associated protein [Pararhodobacter sp.]|nr:HPF/RaiA family ribosome-associated protein [Pararhodobacter sp.]